MAHAAGGKEAPAQTEWGVGPSLGGGAVRAAAAGARGRGGAHPRGAWGQGAEVVQGEEGS